MDTELLKTFLEVSRTRHFGRAAESLYLTQSAVSFRIRQLENQLGVNLFTRHRNNIRLTAAGNRLAFAKIQLIEGITMTLKQLCLFDGEITMTRESTWIMFIVEISISRRKAFRHPARS